VAHVCPHGIASTVDELVGDAELVEWLVPELVWGLRAKDPFADAGSGGDRTRAPTRSGLLRATVWAIRLPMSYPPITDRSNPSSSINPTTLRACASAPYGSVESARCLSDWPKPRKSGTTTSAADDSSGTTSR
jgi:hypothetical protein